MPGNPGAGRRRTGAVTPGRPSAAANWRDAWEAQRSSAHDDPGGPDYDDANQTSIGSDTRAERFKTGEMIVMIGKMRKSLVQSVLGEFNWIDCSPNSSRCGQTSHRPRSHGPYRARFTARTHTTAHQAEASDRSD